MPDEDGLYFSFSFADDLSSVTGDVCVVGPRPERLVAPTPEARPLLRSVAAKGKALPHRDGGFSLSSVGDGGCVRYVADLTAALDAESWRDGATMLGNDAILSPDWWLWAPEGQARYQVFARFEQTGKRRAELPWDEARRGAYNRRVPYSAFVWKAQGSFATRPAKPLAVGAATLDVTVLGRGFGDRIAPVEAWLKQSANAVSSLLGAFPLKRAQVLLVSDRDRSGSFGYVLRGGGPSATMLLPSRPSDDDLAKDWTAVHELLHFSHPPMATSEAWFYEGLATYFTALARARSGMTSKRYGWWELLDGFERGSKIGTGKTLREECATMHENRTYWRVYWTGAFMLLEMDVALRRKGQKLEALVAKLAASRPDDTYRWTAEELMKKLDGFCGCDIPSKVTARYIDDKRFPDVSKLLKRLGVSIADEQSVTYDESAPDAAIRRAIMGGD